MRNNWILLPIVLQIVLALEAYIALAWSKGKAVKSSSVDLKRAALDDAAWPDNVRKINNNIRNQFEVPVLFYVLALMLWQMNAAGALAQTLAWLFAISRVLHSFVHTGSNRVPLRRNVFIFGILVLVAMAVLVLIEAFMPGLGATMPIPKT